MDFSVVLFMMAAGFLIFQVYFKVEIPEQSMKAWM